MCRFNYVGSLHGPCRTRELFGLNDSDAVVDQYFHFVIWKMISHRSAKIMAVSISDGNETRHCKKRERVRGR